MNAEPAFVQAVLENPSDDACLVFSDWLEEQGDPLSLARAELVRVQCELARWVPDLARRTALQAREQQLLADHAREWRGPLHGLCQESHFERGLAHLTLTAGRFLGRTMTRKAAGQLGPAWVRTVRLEDVGKHLSAVARAPHLGAVVALDLAGNALDDDALETLLESPNLGRLAWLDLRCNRLTDAAVRTLVRAALPRLAWLDLRNNGLTDVGMRALLGSPLGGRLAGLELNAPDLNQDTVQDLIAWRAGRDLAERRGNLPVRLVNGLGMEFRLIPPGTFLMGSPASESQRRPNEGPQHEVELTRPFYLGVYPVTQREFQAVMGHNPAAFTAENGGPLHPVENVSWLDGQDFCERLSKRERGRKYRLPTEAEWEYACRAGTTTAFSFGPHATTRYANYDGNYPYGGKHKEAYLKRTSAVGSYPPNAFGLYDMHGNVWEWCQDWYGDRYYQRSPKKDPRGPRTGRGRVLRGGCWDCIGSYFRAAHRYGNPVEGRDNYKGFRVALDVVG
jgi:uncharacterized protein (TIGR02996 family)